LTILRFLNAVVYFFTSESNSLFIKFKETLLGWSRGAYENDDYGNVQVLNEYLGLKISKRMALRINHGWAWKHESQVVYMNNYLPTLVWASKAKNLAARKGWKNFIDVGAPWLYFLYLAEEKGWLQEFGDPSIEELWVYGSHATNANNIDQVSLAKFFDSVPMERHDNLVFLLRDIEYNYLKRTSPDLFNKFKVLTLGPRRDSIFAIAHYFQLMILLRSTKKVVSNYPTTLLLYAHTLGCKISFLEDVNFKNALNFAISRNDLSLQDFLKKNFDNPKDLDDYVNEMLGKESFRSKEELSEMIKPYTSRSMPIRIWNSFSSWFCTLLKRS
jgi:hypothetical protein